MSRENQDVHVVTVRRVDIRVPWPTEVHPEIHGHPPEYPSPKLLRQLLSFAIDFALHLAIPLGVGFALTKSGVEFSGLGGFLTFVGGWFAVSILDRTVVQWLTQASLGKALTGLRVIRSDDGDRPTLWQLVREWFRGFVITNGLLWSS